MSAPSVGLRTWTYNFKFTLPDGQQGHVSARTGFVGIASQLLVNGEAVASDHTRIRAAAPIVESAREHRLRASLGDGRKIRVNLGYVTALKMGIIVFVDGRLIHESHSGQSLDYLVQKPSVCKVLGLISSLRRTWQT